MSLTHNHPDLTMTFIQRDNAEDYFGCCASCAVRLRGRIRSTPAPSSFRTDTSVPSLRERGDVLAPRGTGVAKGR